MRNTHFKGGKSRGKRTGNQVISGSVFEIFVAEFSQFSRRRGFDRRFLASLVSLNNKTKVRFPTMYF